MRKFIIRCASSLMIKKTLTDDTWFDQRCYSPPKSLSEFPSLLSTELAHIEAWRFRAILHFNVVVSVKGLA